MKSRLVGLAPILLVLAAISCAGSKTLHLVASPDVPAAQGTLKTDTTSNGNTRIVLSVDHLASPDRVVAGTTTYVVWVRDVDSGGQIQNLGALRVDDRLRARMDAVTPLRRFELLVTAEESALATAPTNRALLQARVEME
jgi:hypothetical protein